MEAGLSADWLDLERALSCFDAAWDGALKTRRSFEAEVNRVKVPGALRSDSWTPRITLEVRHEVVSWCW